LVFFSGYHDIPMGLPNTLKIRKKILQQTSWTGWQQLKLYGSALSWDFSSNLESSLKKTLDSIFNQTCIYISHKMLWTEIGEIRDIITEIQQTSWTGWQHPDDKWSEAVLDPLPFSGLESYQTWWWTHIGLWGPLQCKVLCQ
jgi:hypothetical protein